MNSGNQQNEGKGRNGTCSRTSGEIHPYPFLKSLCAEGSVAMQLESAEEWTSHNEKNMASIHSTWKTWNNCRLRYSEPVHLVNWGQVRIKGLGLSTLPTTVVKCSDIHKAGSFWSSLGNT